MGYLTSTTGAPTTGHQMDDPHESNAQIHPQRRRDGCLLAGWWLTYPSEKYDFVSWDYDIPKWMEKENMFQTTNQLGIFLGT